MPRRDPARSRRRSVEEDRRDRSCVFSGHLSVESVSVMDAQTTPLNISTPFSLTTTVNPSTSTLIPQEALDCRAEASSICVEPSPRDVFATASASSGARSSATLDHLDSNDTRRPPGHHAEPDMEMGFCLYNNAAVAAAWLKVAMPKTMKRILILDWCVTYFND